MHARSGSPRARGLRGAWALCAVILLSLPALAVRAQESAKDDARDNTQWQLQAWANAAVPPGAVIKVEATDIGERADKVAAVLVRSLGAQGYVVAGDSDLFLRFHINDSPDGLGGLPGRDVVVSGRAGSASRSEVEVDVLLRTKQGKQAVPRLGLRLVLFRKGEPPIWTANINAPRGAQDPARTLVRMTEIAMDYFGQTKERSFLP
ncbi:MAG TPA: hypothetical protein DDW95_07220 [Alphaproteobacteria bacterium]|nr:hypothetical protein [Alphaproteobacteria bacterium]